MKTKKIPLESNIKIPNEFENTLRYVLNGYAKNGWVHAKFEVKIKKYYDDVGLIFKFRSIQDGSILKTIEREDLLDGDTIKLQGMIASYQLEFKDQ